MGGGSRFNYMGNKQHVRLRARCSVLENEMETLRRFEGVYRDI